MTNLCYAGKTNEKTATVLWLCVNQKIEKCVIWHPQKRIVSVFHGTSRCLLLTKQESASQNLWHRLLAMTECQQIGSSKTLSNTKTLKVKHFPTRMNVEIRWPSIWSRLILLVLKNLSFLPFIVFKTKTMRQWGLMTDFARKSCVYCICGFFLFH